MRLAELLNPSPFRGLSTKFPPKAAESFEKEDDFFKKYFSLPYLTNGPANHYMLPLKGGKEKKKTKQVVKSRVKEQTQRLDEMGNYREDELKFWVNPKSGEFIFHDLDEHHVKVVAARHEQMGVPKQEIIHNPYVEGSPNRFGDPDEDEDLWTDEDADNDETVSRAAMRQGWVRGGHRVDPMAYYEKGEIDHEGGIYLEGMNGRELRRAARLVMQRFPEMEFLEIELSEPNQPRRMYHIEGDQIDKFIRKGIL